MNINELLEKRLTGSSVRPDILRTLKMEIIKSIESGKYKYYGSLSDYDVINICVQDIVKEMWNVLNPNERLSIAFPVLKNNIGSIIEIPNKGKGKIIKKELTERFGILVTLQLENNSIYEWEFFE